jgi:hypothetical protein
MKRRTFLALSVAGGGAFSGCSSQSRSDNRTPTSTLGSAATGTPRENPDTVFVSPNGEPDGNGTRESPVTLWDGLEMVGPGETVHALPGYYTRPTTTVRGGTANEPITITGPPDAVFRADGPFEINHDHVHLLGLTFNGLHQPDAPEDPRSYSESLLQVNETFFETIKNGERGSEPVAEEDYLTDIVVKPHAVGNCRADFIKVHWSKNVEIGEFEVIGPAGVKFLKGDAVGHNSEIVYLGNAPSKGYPPDLTRNVHIHHIDNSAGHPHAELVDCKTGTSNVTIEYCTDAGGATVAVSDDPEGSALHIGGTDITVRWNILSNGAQAGIEIDSDIAATENPPDAYRDGGSKNAIYGNQLLDNGGLAIQLPYRDQGQGQADQRVICGNEYNGDTHGTPDGQCPDSVPSGTGIGHTGGSATQDDGT